MMLNPDDITALWITLQLASATTAILLLLGTPLAWWLAHTRSAIKPVVDTIVTCVDG